MINRTKFKLYLVSLGVLCSLNINAQNAKWHNLFDGKTTNGWHSWNKTNVTGWHVMNDALMTHGGNGDLVTDKEYGDYILEFEYKISPKGNSGLIYKVIENPSDKNYANTYRSGPEFQILDDANYPGKVEENQKSGANYDMSAPLDLSATKPADEWNKAKIIVDKNHIEHWLNGKKVADYEYGSEAWKEKLAKSKFKNWPYATPHQKGHIALQDHGDSVSFRKIKIKELD